MLERERWVSKIGFIMAAAGSAIGLGNIWRFPYLAGTHGGSIFIISYILCVAIMGIPIMMAEMILGQRTSKNPVGAFKKIKGEDSPWILVGWMGILSGFIIISYYSIVGGWVIKYLITSLIYGYKSMSNDKIISIFPAFLNSSWQQVTFHAIFMFINVAVVLKGIELGVERFNKIMMPCLFLILLFLATYSLFLKGGKEGIAYIFKPDISSFNLKAFLAAMGQAFFSLSVGMGAMITYGSYLDEKNDVGKSATIVALLDTLAAILACLVIFPIVFTFNLKPEQGPGLVFKTLPLVFKSLNLGNLIAFFFFTLVLFAALTSGVSLIEVPVSYLIDEKGLSRERASILVGVSAFLLGLLPAFSFNLLKSIKIFGQNIFILMDNLASNVMLPLGGFSVAIFAGWFVNSYITKKSEHISGFGVWSFLIRFVSPLAVLIVMLNKLGILNF